MAALNPPAKFPAAVPLGTAPAGTSPIGTETLTGQTVITACHADQSVMVSSNTDCYNAISTPNYPGSAVKTCIGPSAGTQLDEIASTTNLGCWNTGGIDAISGSGACTAYGLSAITSTHDCAAGSGFPRYGSPDFCAAAQHMLNAGVAATIDPASCVITSLTSAASNLCANPLRVWVRSSQPRKAMGIGFENELDGLFTGSNVGAALGGAAPAAGACGSHVWNTSIPRCNLTCAGAVVFHDLTGAGIDDWDIYTYGYTLPGPFGGDALFGLLHGPGTLSPQGANIASNGGITYPILSGPNNASPCVNGTQGDEPGDPTFLCNPTLDKLLEKQQSTLDPALYSAFTEAIYSYYAEMVFQIDVVDQATQIAALRSVGGLVNVIGSGYNNALSLLDAHAGSFNPSASSTTKFGGGCGAACLSTLRFGNADPTSELNIYNAQSVWEFQTIGEIYDTLLTASAKNPSQIFCFMCAASSNLKGTVDVSGNEHFLIELRSNLRWQDDGQFANCPDGCEVTAKDLAFSFLSLRDLGPTSGGALFGTLGSVTVEPPSLAGQASTRVDVVMIGSSITYLPTISTFVIPRHIWGCDFAGGTVGSTNTADDCFQGAQDVNLANGAGLVESTDCTPQAPALFAVNPWGPTCVSTIDYTSQGIATPSHARTAATFDPLASHALIGSGPYECKSIFNSDLGQVGGGCIEDNTSPATTTGDCIAGAGCRSGQTTDAGFKAFLTAFDNTGSSSDGFNQYMRSQNGGYGTGSGAAARSGQYDEFRFVDACNPTCPASYNPSSFNSGYTGDGTIDVNDLSYAIKCGQAGGSPLPPSVFSSSASACSSWAQIVSKHLDDTAIGTTFGPWTGNVASNGGLAFPEGYLVTGTANNSPDGSVYSQCPTAGLSDDPTVCG